MARMTIRRRILASDAKFDFIPSGGRCALVMSAHVLACPVQFYILCILAAFVIVLVRSDVHILIIAGDRPLCFAQPASIVAMQLYAGVKTMAP